MTTPYNVGVCQLDRLAGLSRGLDKVKEVAREHLKKLEGFSSEDIVK